MDPIQVMFKDIGPVKPPDNPIALLVKSEFSAIVVARPKDLNPLKDQNAIIISSYEDLLKAIPDKGELILIGHPSQTSKNYWYNDKNDLDPAMINIINTIFYDG